jgi:peptidoglycan/LPS O-acetylase OafA/YrhL
MNNKNSINQSSQPHHFLEIDSLRCLAMLSVIAIHCKLMPFGWVGVWLFFVISGYVVTLSILRTRPNQSGWSLLKNFSQRRAVRIVPIYFGYALLGAILLILLSHQLQPIALISIMGFFNNIAMILGAGDLNPWPSGHLWTISVEMQFYLVYGAMFFLLPLRWTLRLLFTFVLLAPIGRMCLSYWLSNQNVSAGQAAYTVYAAPLVHFDSFSMGALLAFYGSKKPIKGIATHLVLIGLLAVITYFLIYVGINLYIQDRVGPEIVKDIISGNLTGQMREVFIYSALALFFTGLVALASTRSALTQWLLGNPYLQWVGKVSYGAYIIHALCIKIATSLVIGYGVPYSEANIIERLFVFTLTVIMTLALAGLSFRYIETPINLHYRKKLSKS